MPITGHVRRAKTRSGRPHPPSPLASPEALILPPPLDTIPDIEIPEASLPPTVCASDDDDDADEADQALLEPKHIPWRPNMSPEERDARELWISGARGRKGLRIVIVTGAP